MIETKEILIKKYGKVPASLEEVFSNFEDGRTMFFNGLGNAFEDRKKTPFERYVDIARIVFGFFEQMYTYQRELTFRDKVNILLGKKSNNAFWKEFLRQSLKETVPCKTCGCKAKRDHFLEEYEKILPLCPETKDFGYVSHHFMKKIQKKMHPFMTGYLTGFFAEERELKSERLLFPFLLIESIIHGIDDYVDIGNRNRKEYSADIFNILFGLFSLTFYLLEQLRVEKNEIPRVIFGKKARIEELIDSLFFSMAGLSQVPIIEKNTIKILEYEGEEEMGMAIKNMKVRAAGINIFLVLASYLLRKRGEKDFMLLCDLIKHYRIIELLEKDLKDIPKDLKNKDYTPVAVWWEKYKGKGNFKNMTNSLAGIFYRDAQAVYGQIVKYPSVKSRFMKGMEEKFNRIISNPKRHKG